MIFEVLYIKTMRSSRRGVVVEWQEAALPMCFIVRKITTKGVPQSNAGYLTTSQARVAL
jgi:hypothetical protein